MVAQMREIRFLRTFRFTDAELTEDASKYVKFAEIQWITKFHIYCAPPPSSRISLR